MKLLTKTLCLCLTLVVCLADQEPEAVAVKKPEDELDRCQGLEMDAVTVDEDGVPFFFKGDHLFKGFHGKSELSNNSYEELDNNHQLDHVDAAFISHFDANHSDHDHIFFFLNHKVFRYHHDKLVVGYPKNISEDFPGIPDHLDAAVECPKPECDKDSVIFFKGDDIYYFNVEDKTVEKKEFKDMPKCTSAFRFLEQHYCFHGHQFVQFDPKTGDIHGRWPKKARDYFMRCPEFEKDSVHTERERCSHVHLDAVTSDDANNIYAFRGHHFLHKHGQGNFTSGTIESEFKEIHSDLDAAFTFNDHLYMIKDEHVYAYKTGDPNTLVDGYPKTVKEELGLEGHIDAAFVCQGDDVAHIIQGHNVYEVNMTTSLPRKPVEDGHLTFKKVDAAMCVSKGVNLIVGNHFYHYESSKVMLHARFLPKQHRVSRELFGCDH
ncbi:unnamed protein product [Lota lota]